MKAKNNNIKNNTVNKTKKQKNINIDNRKEMFTTTKILLGFIFAILVGTAFLALPISVVSGESDLLTALFTATTSVCVTGLVVVPTYAHWTLFGKIVILILIQLGGLGVVALTTIILLMINRRIYLNDNLMIQDAFGLNNMRGMTLFVKKVIIGTLSVEMLGALVYMIKLVPQYGVKGVWYSVFNAISAFCNAGIDIIGPDSLMSYSNSPLMLLNSTFLIVMGGLGFVVWFDFIDVAFSVKRGQIFLKDFFRNLKTHTKIVITMTFALLLIGTICTFVFEYNNESTIGGMSIGGKMLNSFFQSVTYRTAGFAAINQAGLTESSVLMGDFVMLAGGSPVGTAGGIKTVTVAVLFYAVVAVVKGRKETVAFNRSIKPDLIRRALAVTFISVFAILFFTILLMTTNNLSLVDSSFEVVSAIATVGLTRDITPTLNVFGKLCIILCMYLGRIGPISLFVFFGNRSANKNAIHFAEAEIMVG